MSVEATWWKLHAGVGERHATAARRISDAAQRRRDASATRRSGGATHQRRGAAAARRIEPAVHEAHYLPSRPRCEAPPLVGVNAVLASFHVSDFRPSG